MFRFATPEPDRYAVHILAALQRRRIYAGTVPAHVVAARRRRNKVARRSRAVNRGRAA